MPAAVWLTVLCDSRLAALANALGVHFRHIDSCIVVSKEALAVRVLLLVVAAVISVCARHQEEEQGENSCGHQVRDARQ